MSYLVETDPSWDSWQADSTSVDNLLSSTTAPDRAQKAARDMAKSAAKYSRSSDKASRPFLLDVRVAGRQPNKAGSASIIPPPTFSTSINRRGTVSQPSVFRSMHLSQNGSARMAWPDADAGAFVTANSRDGGYGPVRMPAASIVGPCTAPRSSVATSSAKSPIVCFPTALTGLRDRGHSLDASCEHVDRSDVSTHLPMSQSSDIRTPPSLTSSSPDINGGAATPRVRLPTSRDSSQSTVLSPHTQQQICEHTATESVAFDRSKGGRRKSKTAASLQGLQSFAPVPSSTTEVVTVSAHPYPGRTGSAKSMWEDLLPGPRPPIVSWGHHPSPTGVTSLDSGLLKESSLSLIPPSVSDKRQKSDKQIPTQTTSPKVHDIPLPSISNTPKEPSEASYIIPTWIPEGTYNLPAWVTSEQRDELDELVLGFPQNPIYAKVRSKGAMQTVPGQFAVRVRGEGWQAAFREIANWVKQRRPTETTLVPLTAANKLDAAVGVTRRTEENANSPSDQFMDSLEDSEAIFANMHVEAVEHPRRSGIANEKAAAAEEGQSAALPSEDQIETISESEDLVISQEAGRLGETRSPLLISNREERGHRAVGARSEECPSAAVVEGETSGWSDRAQAFAEENGWAAALAEAGSLARPIGPPASAPPECEQPAQTDASPGNLKTNRSLIALATARNAIRWLPPSQRLYGRFFGSKQVYSRIITEIAGVVGILCDPHHMPYRHIYVLATRKAELDAAARQSLTLALRIIVAFTYCIDARELTPRPADLLLLERDCRNLPTTQDLSIITEIQSDIASRGQALRASPEDLVKLANRIKEAGTGIQVRLLTLRCADSY